VALPVRCSCLLLDRRTIERQWINVACYIPHTALSLTTYAAGAHEWQGLMFIS